MGGGGPTLSRTVAITEITLQTQTSSCAGALAFPLYADMVQSCALVSASLTPIASGASKGANRPFRFVLFCVLDTGVGTARGFVKRAIIY